MKQLQENKQPYLTLFFDGACPLCKREIHWIRQRTKAVKYVDIADSDFVAEDHVTGLSYDDLMREISGLDEHGKVVTGMDVFRLLYKDAGLGFLMAPTVWPILRPCFDAAYKMFARFRLRLRHRESSCDRCVTPK